MLEDALHHHDAVVGQHPHRQRQPAQRQHVERQVRGVHQIERRQQRSRDRQQQDGHKARIAQKEEQHHQPQRQPDQRRLFQGVERVLHQRGLVVGDNQRHALGREVAVELGDRRGRGIGHRDQVGLVLFLDQDPHGRLAIDPPQVRALLQSVIHLGHIPQAQRDRRVDEGLVNLPQVPELPLKADRKDLVAIVHLAEIDPGLVGVGERVAQVGHRQPVGLQALRLGDDLHRALLPA